MTKKDVRKLMKLVSRARNRDLEEWLISQAARGKRPTKRQLKLINCMENL